MGKYLLMDKIDQDSVHLKTRAPGEKLSGRPLTQQVPTLGLVPSTTQYMNQHSEEYQVAAEM